MKVPVRRVDKPWGHETIWAESTAYAGKTLFVKAGEALSLQYHREKEETLHLASGSVRFWIGTAADELEELDVGPGESVHLVPGTLHRIEALEDSVLLEVSTPHLKDVVRLEDRYGRAGPPAS
jgi:mannose-6-phosphate isomerase-like protein (cupin superfamily)